MSDMNPDILEHLGLPTKIVVPCILCLRPHNVLSVGNKERKKEGYFAVLTLFPI